MYIKAPLRLYEGSATRRPTAACESGAGAGAGVAKDGAKVASPSGSEKVTVEVPCRSVGYSREFGIGDHRAFCTILLAPCVIGAMGVGAIFLE